MYNPVSIINVVAWGEQVGAVALNPRTGYYAFEYSAKWLKTGIELSPFNLPLQKKVFQFPELPEETYNRLPAMLSDALPDKFGHALINAALADEGVSKENITALDRLAYMADRGMGALEFKPSRGRHRAMPTAIQLSSLVAGAKNALEGKFNGDSETESAIRSIIQVGISAGGARAKAVIAWNPETNEIKSGNLPHGQYFEPWLIKLDGVGTDLALGSGGDYGRIEYAYHLMAVEAGIQMSECRLLEENGRAHFMTRRFDREDGEKHHIQTLCAIRHLDFNAIGVHSYNQYLETISGLKLDDERMQQGFRRMVFNVLACNHDDHTKNFSFLFKKCGQWDLSPAYDITFAFNPDNKWTRQQLMSVNGKFTAIEKSDFMEIADRFMVRGAKMVIAEVADALGQWRVFAERAGITRQAAIDRIANAIASKTLRLRQN
ncbi:MAG: type II toxin-antitoxin system HipA family toxin [Gallionella sp.]|nr:type II toxin-antitoxin system HipA family toxin [Gallionella sp.]